MSIQKDFNLFIAGKTGTLKGLQVSKDKLLVKNLNNVKNVSSSSEITALEWGDVNESDILIGTKEQTVKVYDSEFKAFSSCMKTKFGEGPIVGVTRCNDVITTCSASGHVKIWYYNKDKEVEFNTNGLVEKMVAAKINTGIIATGGQKNDLKLWDLNKSSKIFNAKNIKHNELDLEVPIWVSDIAIVPDTDYKVALCSRYGHVRLYDTKTQNRPVINFPLADQSLQTIALAHRDNQAIVGSGTGYILLVDFRMTGNNKVVSSFRGATGSVRQVVCHKTKPYLASVGLDSYFRLHNIDTKKLLHQKFMQVKLNAVLMRSDFAFEPEHEEPSSAEPKTNEATEEMDNMFECMQTIGAKKSMR